MKSKEINIKRTEIQRIIAYNNAAEASNVIHKLIQKYADQYYKEKTDKKLKKECPFCDCIMEGYILTHYQCKECNHQFTD